MVEVEPKQNQKPEPKPEPTPEPTPEVKSEPAPFKIEKAKRANAG